MTNRDLLVAGVSNGSDPLSYINIDGAQRSQSATKGPSDNSGSLILGDDVAANNRHATFVMGELILVGGNLTAETVANFEGYLAHKWGIALDPAHPHAAKFTTVVFDAV